MNDVALYLRYARASLRAQMLYPGAFLTQTAAHFINACALLFGVWGLFDRFGELAGWTFAEIALLFGVANVSFAIASAIGRGLFVFGPQFVRTGDFDRLLLRPRSTALQVLGHEARGPGVGRLVQACIILGAGVALAVPVWSIDHVFVLAAAIGGGIALFTGLFMLQATLTFWTVDSVELGNTLTFGGVEAAQYPLDVYQRWFATFLIAIVPIGCVTYLPGLYLMGRSDALGTPDWFLPVAPVVGFVFFGVSLWLWGFGVRHYRSTGS